jgi:hypothetical protein
MISCAAVVMLTTCGACPEVIFGEEAKTFETLLPAVYSCHPVIPFWVK